MERTDQPTSQAPPAHERVTALLRTVEQALDGALRRGAGDTPLDVEYLLTRHARKAHGDRHCAAVHETVRDALAAIGQPCEASAEHLRHRIRAVLHPGVEVHGPVATLLRNVNNTLDHLLSTGRSPDTVNVEEMFREHAHRMRGQHRPATPKDVQAALGAIGHPAELTPQLLQAHISVALRPEATDG